jgi:hypothetical protein
MTLPVAGAATAPAGGSVSLDFAGGPLGSPAAPGLAAATLEARGREDGTYREQSLAAGSLDARAPSAIAYVAGSISPDTVRAGEVHDITLAVRNDGGSPFVIDPSASRLEVTDGVERVVATGSGAAFSLDPAAQVFLTFPTTAFPGRAREPALSRDARPPRHGVGPRGTARTSRRRAPPSS